MGVECRSDGDCLFQSVAPKGGTLHLTIQQLCMEHLEANLGSYQNTVFTITDDADKVSAKEFIKMMSIPGTYSNEICVQLCARGYHRRDRVFLRWFDNDVLGGYVTYEPLFDVSNDNPINIVHLSDGVGHYQCVCKLENSANSNGSVVVNDLSDEDSLSFTSSACKSPNRHDEYDVSMPDNESETSIVT